MTDDLNEYVNEAPANVVATNTDTPVQETSSWVVPLSEGQDVVTFVEFDRHEYTFKQVNDIDNVPTGKYLVFYRDLSFPENARKYTLMNGMLSDRYTIAKVEMLYNELSRQVQFTSEPILKSSDFTLVCATHTTTPINLFTDDSMKTAMEIITGVDLTGIVNVASGIDIYISNSYNGTRSIHADYVINTVWEQDGVSKKFCDYFILSNKSHSFIHVTNNLGVVSTDLTNLQEYYNSTITVLKSHAEGLDAITEKIAKLMKKEGRIQFNSYWENLPSENKNLLHVLILTSYILNNHYTPDLHLALRSYVQTVLEKLFQQR